MVPALLGWKVFSAKMPYVQPRTKIVQIKWSSLLMVDVNHTSNVWLLIQYHLSANGLRYRVDLVNILTKKAKNASTRRFRLVVSLFLFFSQLFFRQIQFCISELKACKENKYNNGGDWYRWLQLPVSDWIQMEKLRM